MTHCSFIVLLLNLLITQTSFPYKISTEIFFTFLYYLYYFSFILELNLYSKLIITFSTTTTINYLFLYSLFIHFWIFRFIYYCCNHGIWKFWGQGSNWSCSCWPTPQPQQPGIRAGSETYTTAHGSAKSLTHWARPGSEPIFSRTLCQFLNLQSHSGNSSSTFSSGTVDEPPPG